MSYADHFAPAVLLLACLSSFGWGMRKFFVQPVGMTAGMKLITALGFLFGFTHFAAILAVSPAAGYSLPGDVLYVCSIALFWWAIRTNSKRQLSAAFSPDIPSHLVHQGPYRFVRHPFYCSYLLCWLAGCVATGEAWLLVTFIVMLVVYVAAAKQEEQKFTRSPLAEAYREYRASTGMLFPNLTKVLRTNKKPVWKTRLETSERAS